MNGQERIMRIIDHQLVDRVGIFESFWMPTAIEWQNQRLPKDTWPEDFFNLDAGMYWFDQSFLFPRTLIEEDEEMRIVIDEWGTHQKEYKNTQTTPGHIAFSVTRREQWEEEFKPRLVYDSTRINWDELDSRYAHLQNRGAYKMLSVLDPFECTWHKVGSAEQMILMGMDPEWLCEMFDADTTLVESALEEICERGYKPDALWIFGDIAYSSGMLFSPKMYRELLLPFHKRYCEAAHRHGCQVIYHSDGNCGAVIPCLIEAGVDCIHPLEVKAGMDVRELKKIYGDQLAFIGNIDARLFQANDRPGLEAEIRNKVPVAMQGSGYIFHSDHSIPPGTLMETYEFGLALAKEIGQYLSG